MRKTLLVEDKKECCGCGSCVNTCPNQAISMSEDEYGFLYPKISERKCTKCGLCLKVCGYKHRAYENLPIETYAVQTKNSDIKKSASGGAFASIATTVLENGGIVYGSALEYINGKLVPSHIAVTDIKNLYKLCGSKYVQSDIGSVFSDIKKHLKKNELVLFSGTPCQIDGLKSYLQENYKNLFFIDIICHGVPSSKFFQDYVSYLENYYNDKIIDFKFRDKSKGWGLTAKVYTAKGKIKIISAKYSSYYELFLKSYTYRINCYSCPYANKMRVGDITIGDYWGIEEEESWLLVDNGGQINNKKGVSCLIINTDKGSELFEECQGSMLFYKSEFYKVEKHNRQLKKASDYDEEKREKILRMYATHGYMEVENWFNGFLRWKIFYKKFKAILPRRLKEILRLVLSK